MIVDFWHALIQQTFLQYALIGGLLASLACGLIGPFVVVRRVEYVSGGIAHTVLAGLGVAYFFGQNPIIGALITALIAALIIGWVSLKAKKYEGVIISALWSMGMAIGVIFMAKSPGYNVNLMTYLFGDILMISLPSIYLLIILDLVILGIILLFYRQLVATCFDPEFAQLQGLNVQFYYLLLLCMMALTVVSLIQVVGLILVLALLTIPAALARQYMKSLRLIMLVATVFSCVFVMIGLTISYILNLPTGAVIILSAGIIFSLATAIRSLIQI